jgi:hypothetical protein
MINGAHAIVYSTNPDADREFLKDVLGLPHVDVGGGWLIFGLPPAEIAVHPSEKNDTHEIYLMCDDVEAFMTSMKERGLETAPVQDQGWGLLTQLTLPGGGKLGVYQPRHERPAMVGAAAASAVSDGPARAAVKAVKKAAKALKKAARALKKPASKAKASAKAGSKATKSAVKKATKPLKKAAAGKRR